MKFDRTNADLRRKLPEFTYHLTWMDTDGEISAFECGIDREGAFDSAEWAHRNGCPAPEDGYVILTGRIFLKLLTPSKEN